MTRRGLLRSLLAGGIWSALRGHLAAAQPVSLKDVEALQKNWKSLLAEGVKVPLPNEQLKLSKEEWRKRLSPKRSRLRSVTRDPRIRAAVASAADAGECAAGESR